jgi:hypothetical protein
VLIGVFISIVLELCGMSSLAFAVGVYLPVSTSSPIMLGGIARYIADRTAKRQLTAAEQESGPGVLFSSGLIAGASVAGTIVALMQLSPVTTWVLEKVDFSRSFPALVESDLLGLILFLLLGGVLWLVATERWLASPNPSSAHDHGPPR